MADNIEDICNDAIAGVIVKNAYNLRETIEKTADKSCSRSFNAVDMLGISKMSDVLCIEDNNYEQDPTINSHTDAPATGNTEFSNMAVHQLRDE